MKGNISIKEFISQVKNELIDAVDDQTPFFELGEVDLEVAFVLDAKAKAGAKLFVVDIGGEATATQTHRVRLKLKPFVEMRGPDATPEPRQKVKVVKKRIDKKRAPSGPKKKAKKVVAKKRPFKRPPRYR